MITRWHLIKNVLKNVFVLISFVNKLTIMNEKTTTAEKVLIPAMYSANYSNSKNMSVGTVCIKRSKFACMTILSPETVSLVLCQCSITDMQVPPVPNQPKNAEILAQNALKMQIEATIYHFSRERPPPPRPPEFSYQSGDTPSRAFPLNWHSQCHCNFLCINHLQPPQKNWLLPTPI